MKLEAKFKKGDFIIQNNCPDSFAIFGGDIYEQEEGSTVISYSLICYYNPNHYSQNSDGKWVRESVFQYDMDDDEVCEYALDSTDFDYWRLCTDEEINKALKFLANEKRLAWEEKKLVFRKLGVNENIVFDKPKSTGMPGGNTTRLPNGFNNPYYGYQGRSTTPSKTTKVITRVVSETWEQKEPMSTMDDERRSFVSELCGKLGYAFNTTYGAVRVYPTSGAQVPRRMGFDGMCGFEDGIGFGMCAYNALMNGEAWGAYDCCE